MSARQSSTFVQSATPLSQKPTNSLLQRACACGNHAPGGGECAACKQKRLQRSAAGPAPDVAPPIVHEVLRSPGQPLDAATRAFMEPRFGQDFSRVPNQTPQRSVDLLIGAPGDRFEREAEAVATTVMSGRQAGEQQHRDFSHIRIHTDAGAAESARSVGARAYTVGNHIAFGSGQYMPHTATGRHLLAHELAHTVQQSESQALRVQRGCSDPNFCKPYPTREEAESAKWWIRNTYMRAEGIATFGTEVKGLYDRYLSRSPGDSLDPVVFSSDASYLVSAFKESDYTTDDMDKVIDIVGDRLDRAPGTLTDYTPTMMSLSNFLSDSEMANRLINYRNIFSVAGHIAGGIGSSDAGADYRKITYANVTLERIPLIGSVGYVSVELTPHYEVFDTIDFCPGDCGAPIEQQVTVPMSRLEASGEAYDVPFKVIFSPEPRSKRFWFS